MINLSTSTVPFTLTTVEGDTTYVVIRAICDELCSSTDQKELFWDGRLMDTNTVDTDSNGDNALLYYSFVTTEVNSGNVEIVPLTGPTPSLVDTLATVMTITEDVGGASVDMTYEMVFYGFEVFFFMLFFIVWFFRGKTI